MSEAVYDDIIYTEEVKKRPIALNIYVTEEAIRNSNSNTERENSNTAMNQQVQHTGLQIIIVQILKQGILSEYIYIVLEFECSISNKWVIDISYCKITHLF